MAMWCNKGPTIIDKWPPPPPPDPGDDDPFILE